MNQQRNNKIGKIYHYYQYIAYLLSKDASIYPSPSHGDFVTKEEVITSWKNTVSLIKEGRAPKKFCLYIHIPFCKSSCFYCMSGTITVKEKGEFILRYLNYLYEEMKSVSFIVKDLEVTTLYFGGGTPSILEASEIRDLIQNLKYFFNITENTRIIFEASPFSLTREKLQALKSEDVYELALGIQSFDQEVLDYNNRPQNVGKTKEIIKEAQNIGIPSVTADMMLGMPYQDKNSVIESMKEASNLNLDGIWVNSFLPLRHTRFSQQGYVLSEQKKQKQKDIYKEVDFLLRKEGYVYSYLGYRKTLSDLDIEKAYLTQENWNLMGIGYGSYSHAFGSLKYEKIYPIEEFMKELKMENYCYYDSGMSFRCMFDNFLYNKYKESVNECQKKMNIYSAIKMDLKKEMCVYAVTNLPRINLSEFKNLFGVDFLSVFKPSIRILFNLNLARFTKEEFIIKTKNPSLRKVAKAFFVDKDYINRILKSEKMVYNYGVDYLNLLDKISRP